MAPRPDRIMICEYYVKALRTSEASAADQVAPYIAADAVGRYDKDTYEGRDAVLAHAKGKWPMSRYLQKGGWSHPVEEDGAYVVTVEYPPYVHQRSLNKVTIRFNDADEIAEVIHEAPPAQAPIRLTEVPLAFQGLVNNALNNETPIAIAHLDLDGNPDMSLRGSFQFYSPTQISAWIRNAEGGLISAVKKHPKVVLLYRDQTRQATLLIKGTAYVEEDEEIRRRVFDLEPEVEQNHVPDRTGACLMINVEKLTSSVGGRTTFVEL